MGHGEIRIQIDRTAEVVVLPLQPFQPPPLLGPVEVLVGLLGQGQEVLQVAPAEGGRRYEQRTYPGGG